MITESNELPGFYEIPGFSKYLVNRKGEVLNKKTNTILKGSFNPDGYLNYRLCRNDGHTLTIGRHRVMGLAFLHPGGSVDGLVINHILGIKGEDDIDNLEWTTYQGNLEHAGFNGLTSKCRPVSVRDVDTGEVIKYPSYVSAADALGLSRDAISYRLRGGEGKVFPERKQYRHMHSDDPWLIPGDVEKAILDNGLSKAMLVNSLLTGVVKSYDRMSDVAKALNVSPATITMWVNHPNQPVLPGFIQMKWLLDDTPWRPVSDIYVELEKFTKQRVIKVTDSKTGEFRLYCSAKACAVGMGLKVTTLNMRLHSKEGKVFSDGCSYSYYSNAIRVSSAGDRSSNVL